MISFKKKNTKILSYQKDKYLILKKLIIFRIFFLIYKRLGMHPKFQERRTFFEILPRCKFESFCISKNKKKCPLCKYVYIHFLFFK